MNKEQATITRDDALQAVRDRIEAVANVETIEAQMRIEISEIEEKHAARLAAEQQKVEEAEQLIRDYVDSHREEVLEAGAKSTKLGASVVGYRMTPPKVQLRDGFELKSVINKLKTRHPELIITTTSEKLDNKKVLAYLEAGEKDLKRYGIEVYQQENFYIK